MRGRGIQYDTGTFPDGASSRARFEPGVVAREMRIIADDLHCTAVRVTGGDPDRLTVAAEHAAAAGLEVWYSPFPCEMTADELVPYFADTARRAERLRRDGAEVVFVAGCEISLFTQGYLPGATFSERMETLRGTPDVRASARAGIPATINAFFGDLLPRVRAEFGGSVSYAAIPIEHVDWRPFDIVGADAYRNSRNAATYRADLRAHLAHGKPVAITETGCCTYQGAADLGAGGWTVLAPDGTLAPGLVRDEGEQVRLMEDLLPIFADEGVDTAFWFSFAGFTLTHHPDDPAHDLDLASYGIVKMLPDGTAGTAYPDMAWEPKAAFHTLAAIYGGRSGG